jgi:DNA-binding beta-propeller fold protein YncE
MGMKRREFLQASAAAALLAACGEEDAPPDNLRVSRTEVHGVDLNGNLYRATPSADVVSGLGAGGVVTWTTGTSGKGPAQFDFPAGLAGDARGRVLVVDRGNSRVQILEGTSGRYLGMFGSVGSGVGQFRAPRQIASREERIYVVDQLNHRVSVFDLDGRPVLSIGGFGTQPNQLNMPRGVAVDAGGNVYVSDSTADVIKRFSANGTFEGRIDGGNVDHPLGLTFDPKGALWVADGVTARLVVMNAQGAVERTLPTRLPDGRSAAPRDVAVAGRDIYVRAVPNAA